MAVVMTVIGFAQSVEKSIAATVLTLLRGMVFPVIAFLTLPDILGTAGLWCAVPAAEAAAAAAAAVMALSGLFRLR